MSVVAPQHVHIVEDTEIEILPESVWKAVRSTFKELLRVGWILLLCLADLAQRAFFLLPNIIIMLIVGYGIIVLRYGVIYASIILYDFIKAIVAIINGARTVGSIFTFHHYHKISPESLVGPWIVTVKHIPKTCRQFMTWQAELFYFIRLGTHSTLCPVVRYLYPIPWLYDFFMAMFQDLIFDPTPGAPDGNCKRPAGGMLCWVLGLGYFIVHFLVGFTVIVQVILAFLPLIKELFSATLEVLNAAVDGTKRATMKVEVWWKGKTRAPHKPMHVLPYNQTIQFSLQKAADEKQANETPLFSSRAPRCMETKDFIF